MLRQWVTLVLVGFVAVPPHALGEEAVGAVTGYALGESTGATIAPELSLTLVLGTTAVLTAAQTYMQWQEKETRRRYQEAAQDGIRRVAKGELTPITNAGSESSLGLVATLDSRLRLEGPLVEGSHSEVDIVRLIVARAKQLE